jgi:iron(III) transport system ATP-binding protein
VGECYPSFLYTLRLKDGQMPMAHMPSHHDDKLGEWIDIRAEVNHVVTFKWKKV